MILTSIPWPEDDTRILKERLQVRDYDNTRALLNRLYPERGRLLEIGSSLGYLLDVFRKDGWDVLGVEPFYQCCRYSREELGSRSRTPFWKAPSCPMSHSTVVLLNHVIEHIDDPLRTLREVNRVLKPGGHFVIETPRYDTLMFKLMGKRERSVSCGGHIYFFTTESLKNLYEAAGFKTIELNYVGRSLTVERLIYNIGVVTKSPGLRGKLDKLVTRLGVKKASFYLNFRDMQRVCVQKVGPARQVSEAAKAEAATVATV